MAVSDAAPGRVVETALIVPAGFPYPDVVRTLDPHDMMFSGNHEHYLSVGLSALAGIEHALAFRPVARPVTRILDLPCGYGRVTRALRLRFPDGRITVSDLDPDAVAFCTRTFAARGVASCVNIGALDLGDSFDLIWVGSLLTHLDAAGAAELLRCCLRHLAEGGIAVVSAHGAFVAGRMTEGVRAGRDSYGLPAAAAAVALEAYFTAGYGFAAYGWADAAAKTYGISVASEGWLRAQVAAIGGVVLAYEPHVWDRHHDLMTFAASAVTCD